jgi:hypothetical protein
MLTDAQWEVLGLLIEACRPRVRHRPRISGALSRPCSGASERSQVALHSFRPRPLVACGSELHLLVASGCLGAPTWLGSGVGC